MRLLITGANGQLGHEVVLAAQHKHDVLAADVRCLDITDTQAVRTTLEAFRPDVVVNAAAYTAVDKAESEQEQVFSVNRDGPAHLAVACDAANIRLIHISTDYIFDGSKDCAYTENDPAEPLSAYGESKLAGEEAVRHLCSCYVILRTSWMFSEHGQNFVKTMLKLGGEREELGVVVDQYGCPTSATELARGIMRVIEHGRDVCGTYHFCQQKPTTWYGFAAAVFDEAKQHGICLKIRQLKPIATSDYPTLAGRPVNSVMDCRYFESSFGFHIQPWRESLVDVIKALNVA